MVGGLPKFALTFSRDFVAMFAKVITEEFVGDLEGGFVLSGLRFELIFLSNFEKFLSGFDFEFSIFFAIESGVGNSGGGSQFFNSLLMSFFGGSDVVVHRRK